MKFSEIPQFPQAHYQVNVSWDYLEVWLDREKDIIDLDPDFQRGHVWSPEQQKGYVEYILQGGEGGRNVYWNCPGWPRISDSSKKALVLVDGKQRIEAVRAFLRGEVLAFGLSFSQFEGSLGPTGPGFVFQVAGLKKRSDILKWYLDFNAGGTPHSSEEITRVRELLAAELKVSARRLSVKG